MRNNRLQPGSSPSRRRGAVLILAMIITFTLASMVIVLGRSISIEARAAANRASEAEARAIARGAEQYVMALLAERTDDLELFDERLFAGIPVGNGQFWIVRPNYGDPTLPVYGLVDESAKLNINREQWESLRLLAGMTDQIAGAIIDWRDEDEETSSTGAESDVYLRMQPPYQAKNAPFETVEELLLVQGMSRELLYGPPGGQTTGLVSSYYQSNGLYDFFTVWGGEQTRDPEGNERIDVNDQSEQTRNSLRELLRERLGESIGNDAASRLENRRYAGLFDFARRLGLDTQNLELIEPYIRFSGGSAARINVNQAPREVLEAIDGLNVGQVNALLAERSGRTANNPMTIAWVQDVVDSETLARIGDRFTAGGGVYSADIVAVSGDGRAAVRVRIVVDITGDSPRIVYRRDITEWGLPQDDNILAAMQTGSIQQ